MRTTFAVVLALLAPALSGCLGGEARTEWAFETTQLSSLADAGRTGHGVTIAILDTGINVQHVALRHLVDGNPDNGELVAFQDYMANRNGVASAYDDDGHGSHVAGIIAASGSSLTDKLEYGGINLLGGAPGAKLVVAKVCGVNRCNADAIPKAIQWAVSQHADVINLSLGGVRSNDIFSNLAPDRMTQAIQAAVDKGVVVVAAAGNDGPANADVSTPADVPDVLAVGAIQEDGAVWENSSRGDDAGHPCGTSIPILGAQGRCDPNKKPELVAPGVEILSAWTGDKYVRATGTSQATPFVTAAVALLLEGRAHLTGRSDVVHVKQVLIHAAKPVPGARLPHDPAAGYGLLQAKAAYDAYR
ncbi:MAG: S8 family serine peptidase [Thermoplasmatota archaeon]|nr:S8 family serine peptidase [Halobacteriales archaeon]